MKIKIIKLIALVITLLILAAALAWVVYGYPLIYSAGLVISCLFGINEYRDSAKNHDVRMVTIMLCLWWPVVVVGFSLLLIIWRIEESVKGAILYKKALK